MVTKGKWYHMVRICKKQLGQSRARNITACDMQNFFARTMHLAIRSVETLSIQLGMCAIVKLKKAICMVL